MALVEQVIGQNGIVTINKIGQAIDLLREFEPMALQLNPEGYYLCYSGGKDSDILLNVAIKAGVKFTANYNVTGIDPKEVVIHIKEIREWLRTKGIKLYMHSPDLFTTGIFRGLPMNMWRLIIHKMMPPTRLIRFCCSGLKEHGGEGQLCLTGVRWAESTQRKSRKPMEIVTKKKSDKKLFNDNTKERRQFENCMQKGKRVLNPVIHLSDKEVWKYLKENKCSYCKLYNQGKKRIGCIGCPNSGATGMEEDFELYPHIKQKYIDTYDLMLERMKCEVPDKPRSWRTGEDVLEWQMYGSDKEHQKIIERQVEIMDWLGLEVI